MGRKAKEKKVGRPNVVDKFKKLYNLPDYQETLASNFLSNLKEKEMYFISVMIYLQDIENKENIKFSEISDVLREEYKISYRTCEKIRDTLCNNGLITKTSQGYYVLPAEVHDFYAQIFYAQKNLELLKLPELGSKYNYHYLIRFLVGLPKNEHAEFIYSLLLILKEAGFKPFGATKFPAFSDQLTKQIRFFNYNNVQYYTLLLGVEPCKLDYPEYNYFIFTFDLHALPKHKEKISSVFTFSGHPKERERFLKTLYSGKWDEICFSDAFKLFMELSDNFNINVLAIDDNNGVLYPK